MGLSSAVDWWEEWQLRILVIGSQFVQWLLFLSAFRRKSTKSASTRLLIWLAYIGSDAVAIYALAALFNRHKKQGDSDSGLPSAKSVLEVVWAPVLLMHLGGQDCITAYNMEDNELWKRHVLTAISQLTVSIYVFSKSWQGDDKKLLQAAILLFTLGGIRCLEKPLALQRASINSLASASDTTVKQTEEESKINSPSAFVKGIWHLYQAQIIKEKGKTEAEAEAKGLSVKARGVDDDLEANDQPSERAGVEDGDEANRPSDKAPGEDGGQTNIPFDEAKRQVHSTEHQSANSHRSDEQEEDQVNKLFVDLASPYLHRLSVTQSFLELDGESAYKRLQKRLSATFDLLYTKKKMSVPNRKGKRFLVFLGQVFRFACIILPFAAIGLFDRSHREAHDPKDVKITYTLLCCTAVMEFLSYIVPYGSKFSGMVGQYSFMEYFTRNTTYNKRMSILGSQCKAGSPSSTHNPINRWGLSE